MNAQAHIRQPVLTLEKRVTKIVDMLYKGVSVVGSSNTLTYLVNDILASTPWLNFKHPAPLTSAQRDWLCDITAELSLAYHCLPPFTDILGPIYMQYSSRNSKSGLGQFFSPPSVCDIISEIVYHQKVHSDSTQPLLFSEPCVGSGSMPLSFCRQILRKNPDDLLRLHAHMGDLDILCCKMTAAQFVLNFIAFNLSPIEGFIYHGNSLGNPELYISWQCDLALK